MKLSCLFVFAVIAALVPIGVGEASAAPDPAYPTGTFTLDRTSTYLHDHPLADYAYATFLVHRTSLVDDATAAPDILVQVDPGDGRTPQTWTYHQPQGGADYFPIDYDHHGTFHPQITLTDADGHRTTIELGALNVLQDRTPPAFTLTKPRHVHRTGAWHRVVGTYSDAGVGLNYVDLRVLQKRRGYWYAFSSCCSPHAYRWLRGRKTLTATLAMHRYASIEALATSPHRWQSHWISGLTRGPLVIVARAEDNNANGTPTKTYKVQLTR